MCGLKAEEFYFTESVNRCIFSIFIHSDIDRISWQSEASALVCPSLCLSRWESDRDRRWQSSPRQLRSNEQSFGLLGSRLLIDRGQLIDRGRLIGGDGALLQDFWSSHEHVPQLYCWQGCSLWSILVFLVPLLLLLIEVPLHMFFHLCSVHNNLNVFSVFRMVCIQQCLQWGGVCKLLRLQYNKKRPAAMLRRNATSNTTGLFFVH